MAIKILGWDGAPFDLARHIDGSSNLFMQIILLLVFSGNYTTGGDTLDFTNAANPTAGNIQPPSAGIIRGVVESNGGAAGFGATGGFFALVAPGAPPVLPGPFSNGWKLKVFNIGAEFANGAYSAAILADVVTLELTVKKF